MKQRYFTVFFLLSVIFAFFYYFNQKKDAFLLDKQLVDAVHVPKVNSLFEKADAAKYAQDYKKADFEFKKLLKKPISTADSQYVLNQLAFINLSMNEDSMGHQFIQQSEKMHPLGAFGSITTERDSISAQSDYYYNVGTWAYHTFKPKMAEIYLKKALQGYEKIYGERHLKMAMCLTQIGHLFYEFSDYPDSMYNYIPRAYDIFKLSPHLKTFSGYNELGMVYVNFTKRNNEMGSYHADNAIHLLSISPFIDSITLARATSFKGQMIKKIGDVEKDTILQKRLYNEAENYFIKGISYIKEAHPRYQEMLRNHLILNIFKHDSILFFTNLKRLDTNVKQRGNYYAFEDRLLAYYYAQNGNNGDDVIYHYEQFLKKYAQDSLVGHILKTESFFKLIEAFSDTSSSKYNPKESLRYANAWLTGNHQLDLAETELTNKPYSAMYGFIPLNLVASAYWQKYLKYKKVEDLKKTIEVYKRTDSLLFSKLNILENNVMIRLQNNIGNTLYPTALKAIYEYYSTTKDKRCFDNAFRFSERMKSDILFRDIELLNKNDSITVLKSEFDKLVGESNVHQLNDYETTDRITYLNRQLEKLMLLKGSESNASEYSLTALQQKLSPNQAVIQYNLDKEQTVLHALYFSKDTVCFYQFASKDLKTQLTYYQKRIKDYSNTAKEQAAFSQTSYYLYQKLIEPFEADLQKKNDLIIIPDRNLHQIPFESLMTSNTFTDFKSASYLINRPHLTISYAPSWKIFELNLSKSDVASNDKLLYFTYGKNTAEIPCAGEEVDNLKMIFGQQANFFTDSKCTKNTFLKTWTQNYGILQLALHAQGKTDSIFNNKIWFQPNKQDALYGFELTGTQTPIKLVVLSACETNVGNTDLGEGVYSMARYFFQSNAKVVIASLWQIEDCPNAQIMRNFYKILRGGQKPKQALCEAKRLFLKQSSDNLLAHPSYWAGLICLD